MLLVVFFPPPGGDSPAGGQCVGLPGGAQAMGFSARQRRMAGMLGAMLRSLALQHSPGASHPCQNWGSAPCVAHSARYK